MESTASKPEGEVHMIKTTPPTTDPKPIERINKYLWYLRFIQILFALIIVGIAGSNISNWHSYGCSSPSGLSFNFAIAILSLFLLIYLLLSTGPYFKIPWYSFLAILAFEILFIIFWIVAAALAAETCTSLCNACTGVDQGQGYFVWVNDLICKCWIPGVDSSSVKRDSPGQVFKRATGRPSSGEAASKAGGTAMKGVGKAAKQGLDAAMILLFITSLISLLRLRYSKKGNETPAPMNVENDAETQRVHEHVDNKIDHHVDNTYQMRPVGPSAE